jgi:hypothetical protein
MAFIHAAVVPAAQAQKAAIDCRPVGGVVRLPELPEASGIAPGSDGRLWAHNDSGDPVLIELDQKGRVVGRLRLGNVGVEDWEAIATGPCPAGSCLYVADIGDNDAERESIRIHRIPEPLAGKTSVSQAETIQARYPDGKHDAETLLVTPKGEVFVVTKGETGPVALYRLPDGARPGATVELVRASQPLKQTDRANRITDGAVSPDGAWVVLRTNRDLRLYPAPAFLNGSWPEAARVDLQRLGEPQGEGVTFADNRTLIVVGEGGGKSQPGTFARLACTF